MPKPEVVKAFMNDQPEKFELKQFLVNQIQEKVKHLCRKRKQTQTKNIITSTKKS